MPSWMDEVHLTGERTKVIPHANSRYHLRFNYDYVSRRATSHHAYRICFEGLHPLNISTMPIAIDARKTADISRAAELPTGY